jgi:hypothetical protein
LDTQVGKIFKAQMPSRCAEYGVLHGGENRKGRDMSPQTVRSLFAAQIVLAVSAATFLTATATAASATTASAPATATVVVSSTSGWQKTPINLVAGDGYTISYVSGSWTVDYRNFPRVGPGGYSDQVDGQIYQGCKYDAHSNYAVLLGAIGDSASVIAIGRGGAFDAKSSGPLYLRINDDDACLGDNAGSVKMTIDEVTAVPQSAFSGYSAQTDSGHIVDVSADWTVPKVSCSYALYNKPRAAVWVGMWGDLQAQHNKTSWLPQIGTSSDCRTLGAAPIYRLAWELYSQVSGGGNAIQYGMSVSPGDQINAAVDFLGPYTSTSVKRNFEIRLTDLTTGNWWLKNIQTNMNVGIDSIARQGGAIVENNGNDGLASFSPPINLTKVILLTTARTFRYVKWVMKMDNGHVLATVGALSVENYGSVEDKILSYTVKWLRKN